MNVQMRAKAGAALLAAAAYAVTLAGCRGAEAEASERVRTPAAPATQYIVAVDISASRTESQLREAQELVRGLVARIGYGDRLVLLETYRAANDSAAQWQDSVPAPRDPSRPRAGERKRLERFQLVAGAVVPAFFDPRRQPHVLTTDLFQTLGRVADYAHSSGGRRTVVLLLSDMLQSTGEVNMERAGGIPNTAWIAARKRDGRLPALGGTCVYVAGADVGSARGVRVREFWRDYFEAAGAELSPDGYRNMLSDPGELRCD